MSDYISREAVKEKLMHTLCLHEELPYLVDSIPAADVRPVVLCRDCQNSYEWANVDGDNYRYCCYLRSRWNHDIDLIAQKPKLKRRIVYRGAVYNAIEAERINHLDGILSDRYKEGFHDGLKRALEILGGLPDAEEGE